MLNPTPTTIYLKDYRPPAFLISDITVTDDAKFKAWGERINPTFEKRGAKYLARGGQTMAVGGSCNGNELPKRAIIIMSRTAHRATRARSARTWSAVAALSPCPLTPVSVP
jgi:uncharacterized protein (DUF1330 family)